MPFDSPHKSNKEVTAAHFFCIQPLDEVSLSGCVHPAHHEMLSLSSAPDPRIFFEDPSIMDFIHFDNAHPHREYYRRTRIFEMIELPFSPGSKESECPLHNHVHPGTEHSQEDPEKTTSPSSSEPKNEEKLERVHDDDDENVASNGNSNNLSASKDPDDSAATMYTCTVEYQWSPMLKYCTMEELGYQPLNLL
ncbi:EPR1: Proline-rich extensin-like EPR1 [Crotalus adamanteus]|uniref:EPR1: Proline-rich extensin-like EPR1 n=1 Tax=Crotalus adamanteus TaxID=8729 RepID=A0AAW1AMC2_CROAD